MGFIDAVRDLAQQTGMLVPEDSSSAADREQAAAHKQKQATLGDVLARAADGYRRQLKSSDRAIAYLKGRGLSGEIAAQFGLGYAPEGWRGLASVFPSYDDPLLEESGLVIAQAAQDGDDAGGSGAEAVPQKRYDRFRDRIMFPIRSVQGAVIGFGGRVLDRGEPKYLNSPETPVFSKGHELYGLFEARTEIRRRGHVLVVEGYMDVVALAQAGFGNAVATLGTACTAEHVHKLVRFSEAVVFSFDGDAAGRRAAGRALEASLPHATDMRSFRFLFLPAEHDPDTYVREHGAKAFEARIAEAVPLSRQIIALAGEDIDFATAEGRARFLGQARPLWSALPDGMLKRQLLGEIASRAALPADELAALWRSADAGRPRAAGAACRSSDPAAPRNQAGDAAAAGSARLDAPARERLVGRPERAGPCPPLRLAGVAWRGVPLRRPRGRRARRRALGGPSGTPGRRAVGSRRAGGDRRRGRGHRTPRRRPAPFDVATACRGRQARGSARPRQALNTRRPAKRYNPALRDRGVVTAAPPGPGHPLNEGPFQGQLHPQGLQIGWLCHRSPRNGLANVRVWVRVFGPVRSPSRFSRKPSVSSNLNFARMRAIRSSGFRTQLASHLQGIA